MISKTDNIPSIIIAADDKKDCEVTFKTKIFSLNTIGKSIVESKPCVSLGNKKFQAEILYI